MQFIIFSCQTSLQSTLRTVQNKGEKRAQLCSEKRSVIMIWLITFPPFLSCKMTLCKAFVGCRQSVFDVLQLQIRELISNHSFHKNFQYFKLVKKSEQI